MPSPYILVPHTTMNHRITSRRLDTTALLILASSALVSVPARAQDGPSTTPEQVAAAVAAVPATAPGPVQPSWDSVKANYQTPKWFLDGKFGIFIHWGLYSVPGYHNEWYQKYMYGNAGIRNWHINNYGLLDKFGYINFADKFATKFDPKQWADLFKKSGATYIVPTAEHHDWFSLWDSQVSPWNSMKMGPKRDLIGELATAVRADGMKFGVSNHSIEHYTFIKDKPPVGMASDLTNPALSNFYWTDHNDANLQRFLRVWIQKNVELIDKYQPDMLWFDNGINRRAFDPLKLKVAAYYYNRAKTWGKEVSISSKSEAFLGGTIMDYERQGRAPKELTDFPWQPDDPIGPTFGYTTIDRGHGDRNVDMAAASPNSLIDRLVQNVSRNGNYLLNISPRGDGTIPENQQQVLLAMGKWLGTNGDAIYGTRAWTKSNEGNIYFTTKGRDIYAIGLDWFGAQTTLKLLASGAAGVGKVTGVELLGQTGALQFTQDADGLKVTLPAEKVGDYAFALKISGAIAAPFVASLAPVAAVAPLVQPVAAAKRAGGISGPGKPFVGDVSRLLTAKASGSAVKNALLPPIKPIIDMRIRDTVICTGGDGNYYLTGSTGDDIWAFNDGIELWRSPDLKNWSYVGLVWETMKDGTWEKQPRDLHGKPTVTIWAPEIHYVNGNYFIVLSMAPGGISLLKSTTGKAQGPYVNAVPGGAPLRGGGIDATLFQDDDGAVYFTSGGGNSISRMKDDMSGFAETRAVKLENPDHDPTHHAKKCFARGMNDFGHEGTVLFKANGKYYHGAVDDYEGRYSSCVAMSDTIWGPYKMRHETMPTGGGTNFFKDKQGGWWGTYFGNDYQAPWREMPGLVKVEFAPDGKIKVAKKQPDFVLQGKA